MWVLLYDVQAQAKSIVLEIRVVNTLLEGISDSKRRRKSQPTPVFLPGEFSGQRSLAGCCPWGCTERTRLKRLSMHACMHWRRKWQPTPVFLPGEFSGQRSLAGCCPWGCTERTRLKRLSSSSSSELKGSGWYFWVMVVFCFSYVYQMSTISW